MRKDNRKKKIPDGSKNSLILVSDENQLQENENQILVSNPRHDQELILLIESEQYEAAKELASQHFLSEISENLATAFPFLEEPELNLAFDKALDKLILFVEEQTISLKDGQIEGCPSILQFLKDESLIFIKNQVQHKDKNREDYKAIQAIMKGDDKSFTWAYHAYRSYFLGYAKHNFPKCSHEVVADAYQDALIVLIEDYIRSGRFCLRGDWIFGLRKGTKLKTFIVSIGRRLLARNCNTGNIQGYPFEDFDPEMPENGNDNFFEKKLMEAIRKLKKRCKRLLFYRYWLGLSYEEIKEITDARSAGSVRVMTLRCREELREKVDLTDF